MPGAWLLNSPPRQIHVAAAAIVDTEGRILVARRPQHVHQGGLWEFPGGKLEAGETLMDGLVRELDEELGIRVLGSEPLIRVHHDYGDRHVLLDVHRVSRYEGDPRGREGQPLRWLHPRDMLPEDFPAADRPIISALRLPERMVITGPDPNRPERFLEQLEHTLAQGARLVQLRAPGLAADAYLALARQAAVLCQGREAALVLNPPDGCDTALIGPLPGLHLPARRLLALRRRPLPPQRLVGASCHDARELEHAARLGLDYALLSPVRQTASHPDAPPLGWERFAELADRAALPVFALGGMGPGDERQARHSGGQGVAGISGFWPG
jgi:8-oxo-dGTP diphosphatase